MMTERAIFDFEVRDLQRGRADRYTRLEGRAVPYNTWANVGPYLEQFKPGAFNKSISEARALPLTLFHGRESPWPIGKAEKWESHADGLYGTWSLNDSDQAQQAARMAEEGDLGYLSIEFMEIRSLPDLTDDYNPELGVDHMDRYTRIEARLVGTSLVTNPAYVDAQVTLVRDYRRPAHDPYPRLTAWKREAAGLPR